MARNKGDDLFSMLDGDFAEGHEILNLMQMAAEDPSVELTDREKCRLFLLRLFIAAATEGTNRAREKFSLSELEVMIDLFITSGEAIASIVFQGFDLSTPRAQKLVRNEVKAKVMMGYDHFIKAMFEANARGGSVQ